MFFLSTSLKKQGKSCKLQIEIQIKNISIYSEFKQNKYSYFVHIAWVGF